MKTGNTELSLVHAVSAFNLLIKPYLSIMLAGRAAGHLCKACSADLK